MLLWNMENDTYDHQLMANKYITTIKTALKDFESSYDKDVYIVLAWQGLKATDAYSKLTQQKKDSFIKTLTEYRTNNKIIECK